MKQAALKTKQTTRVMPVTMDQMDNPSTWLHLNINPDARGCIPRDMRRSDGLHETMENIVLRADPASTYVIARPPEPLPSERRGLCIQLESTTSLPKLYVVVPDERHFLYVEHLCMHDFDQGLQSDSVRREGSGASFPTGGPWFGESTAIAYEEVRDLENSFHQRGVRQALQSSDPLVSEAVSIELGFSTMPGGSELQMTARRNGQAFELRATEKAKELGAHASIAAHLAWTHVQQRFPKIAQIMLEQVGIYGIYGTGFSKVTIAYDNPTNVHYDDNFGADVVLAFGYGDLKSGSDHVMTSHDGRQAIIVETSPLGTIVSGNHQHVLHGNLGTTNGGRVIYAFYLSKALLNNAPNRFHSASHTWQRPLCKRETGDA